MKLNRVAPYPRLRLTDEELDAALAKVLEDPSSTVDELVELTESVVEVVDEWARDSLGVTEKRVREAMRKKGWTFEPEAAP